jgi:hypothetical protein
MLDIDAIVTQEKSLRHNLIAHIRGLFSEPRSNQQMLDVKTVEEAYGIACLINTFYTDSGKALCDDLSTMIYLLLDVEYAEREPESLRTLNDLEFIRNHKVDNEQFISLKFCADHDDEDQEFCIFTHALAGIDSAHLRMDELATLQQILSLLKERK